MIVGMCGSRSWRNIEIIEADVRLLEPLDDIVIVGDAGGADAIITMLTRRHGVQSAIMRAYWDLHKRRAGSVRNRKMFDLGIQELYVYTNGTPGSTMMIGFANERGIPIHLREGSHGTNG